MKQYVVDAFTDTVFKGNPAAVCIMDSWIDDDLMLSITRENNLSETAFAVKENKKYRLRWFTPGGEIDLCGHATLATAFVITNFYEKNIDKIVFDTLSGELTVHKKGELFELNFPSYDLKSVEITEEIIDAIGVKPLEVFIDRDLVCVLENSELVEKFEPNLEKMKLLDGLLLHITAKADENSEFDCISRSFAPKLDVAEDPVCGSGHCHLVPLWSDKLGKNEIVAFQASKRTGILYCKLDREKNRVSLSGKAVLFAVSEIFI